MPDVDQTQSDPQHDLKKVVIHFAGDSGDGMQVIGWQFTQVSAAMGNDVRTFVDYPSEIRAPVGTTAGISGFQLCFSEKFIHTVGDQYDVLVAMNPAAMQVGLSNLVKGGLILVDSSKFTDKDLKKAKVPKDFLTSEALANYQIVNLPMTTLTLKATSEVSLSRAKSRKCKNMFVLGVVAWLFNRPLKGIEIWIKKYFEKMPDIVQANLLALKAGYNYAITAELLNVQQIIKPAKFSPGHYRHITGNQAFALGAVASAYIFKKKLVVAGYPITPASDILHYLAQYKQSTIQTLQLEDEISAACSVIGAAYGGALALTLTSGPGMDLKTEAIGLAVMAELPMVIVNVQRAGPSTGMPTKVEQSDLLAALYGRHGECPVPVLAASSAKDCFYTMIEAFQIAVKAMTPVIVLSDACLANSAEPWKIPEITELPDCSKNASHALYQRDAQSLAPSWIIPGTPEMMYRTGGLEKIGLTGSVSSDPDNHQKMITIRAEKINRIAENYSPSTVVGKNFGDLLLIGWGSTQGVIQAVVEELSSLYKVSALHCRYLFPLPKDIGEIMKQFARVVVVELNTGQLSEILRAKYLLDIQSISKVTGQPFKICELRESVLTILKEGKLHE